MSFLGAELCGSKEPCFFLPDCLLGLLPGLFLLSYLLFLIFLYFFITVPCARLGWPPHQLLSACEYTVSYRIEL